MSETEKAIREMLEEYRAELDGMQERIQRLRLLFGALERVVEAWESEREAKP